MRTVANCFSTGFGFEKDSEKSLQWLCLASEKGHAVAQYELGNYYYKPGPHHSFELSFQNYVKSANNGYSYALGDLLDEEFSQYCSLFEKEIHETSARMGRPYSQSYLGSNLHRKGETVLAFPLLVAAARGGRPVAMFNLSHYFLHSHSLDHPDSLITGIRLLMNYFEMEDTKDERKEVLDYILNSAIKMWTEKKFNDAKYVFEWRLQRKDTNSQVAIKSNEISRNTWIQQSEAFLLLQNPRCNQHSIMNSVPKHLFQPIIELFKPPPFYKRLSQIAESIYPGITLSNYITDYRDTEAGLEDEFILLFLHPQSQEMPISMRYRNSSTSTRPAGYLSIPMLPLKPIPLDEEKLTIKIHPLSIRIIKGTHNSFNLIVKALNSKETLNSFKEVKFWFEAVGSPHPPEKLIAISLRFFPQFGVAWQKYGYYEN
eukprot:TRINITY_DN4997_c0_g1_i3.p1 TRINITY_DN4997_c0_g1~~TRINITY_DN4997_c0_g1_i3.p1  ORF type:complete len:429 (+),score=89.77 TRINITY_DN4997_c0_g1_i3:417-1703(+)